MVHAFNYLMLINYYCVFFVTYVVVSQVKLTLSLLHSALESRPPPFALTGLHHVMLTQDATPAQVEEEVWLCVGTFHL